jgi:hypothetical protein
MFIQSHQTHHNSPYLIKLTIKSFQWKIVIVVEGMGNEALKENSIRVLFYVGLLTYYGKVGL